MADKRILTTHAGSLPRPQELVQMLFAREAGEPLDEAAFDQAVRDAVADIVRKQAQAGIDIVSDGEMSKPSFATYVKDRLTGFGGESSIREIDEEVMSFDEFADFAQQYDETWACLKEIRFTANDGPVAYVGQEALRADVDNLAAAIDTTPPTGAFMAAASPGIIARTSPNGHYAGNEEYLAAIVDAMRVEYKAIHDAGFVLQLDCPDLAEAALGAGSVDGYRRLVEQNVEALNAALVDIPAEAARIHVCWGSGEHPRVHDIELAQIIDLILKAKPAGIMLMASNGRHAHEWQVFQDVKLPDGKYVIPGVVDSSSNIVEHPEVVAMRIKQYADVVGRDNVMAGTDCGFGTFAGQTMVVPSVVWAKFRSMAEGAELASRRLWP